MSPAKPRLRRLDGLWWCGRLHQDFFTWATCAPTAVEAYKLWAMYQR